MAEPKTPERTSLTAKAAAQVAEDAPQESPKAESEQPEMTEAQFKQGVEKYAAAIINDPEYKTLEAAVGAMKTDVESAVNNKVVDAQAGKDIIASIDEAATQAKGDKNAFPTKLAGQLAENKDEFTQILQRDQAGDGGDLTSKLQGMGPLGMIFAFIAAFMGKGNIDIERLMDGFIEKKDPGQPLVAENKQPAKAEPKAKEPDKVAVVPPEHRVKSKPENGDGDGAQPSGEEPADKGPADKPPKPDRIDFDGPTRIANNGEAPSQAVDLTAGQDVAVLAYAQGPSDTPLTTEVQIASGLEGPPKVNLDEGTATAMNGADFSLSSGFTTLAPLQIGDDGVAVIDPRVDQDVQAALQKEAEFIAEHGASNEDNYSMRSLG